MLDGLSLTWSFSWGVVACLLLFALLYVWGVWQVQAHRQQDAQGSSAISATRIATFFVTIAIIALLLLTPINTIARTQLFFVHMIQAVLLTTLCAPLIMFACPAHVLQPLFEIPILRTLVRMLTSPIIASLIFNLTFLLWHLPKFYNIAMFNNGLYQTMLLSIFFTSLLNWFPLIGPVHEARRMKYPVQMLYAFFDGQPVDILAFVLVFSGVPIYSHYIVPHQIMPTAFADQAIGGGLLLLPGLVDLAVMTPLFFRWLGQIEKKTRQADLKRQVEYESEDEFEVEEQHPLQA